MDVDFFTKQFITMKGNEHHYRAGAYRPPVYPEGTHYLSWPTIIHT